VSREDLEDAELEGDRPFHAGTARAALSYSGFRRVFAGSVTSNVGSWMQSVVLNAYALLLSGSPVFVAVMNFATLGPLLLLSVVGGSLADRYDRKWLIIIVSLEQALFAFVLAVLARGDDPNLVLLVGTVFAINVGQALVGPAFSAVLPSLVERRDLTGAVSLTSVNLNLSRVIGALIGPLVFARFGVPWVFVVNGISYFAIIAGVASVDIPRAAPDPDGGSGWQRILDGFRMTAADPIILRVMLICAAFSFFSLIFVTEMSLLASANLGIAPKSGAYGLLFALFGLGAVVGALSIGTIFADTDMSRLVRVGLFAFAAALTVFALCRQPVTADIVVFVVGFFYFMALTSLSNVLQHRLTEDNRGRVLAVWIMSYGGMVAIGPLVLGPVIALTSITVVVIGGAAVAVLLGFLARFEDPSPVPAPATT
jgi:MFS family permease